ncbi:MAG: Zn-ribbon domain-containing OB-fold protein, partial [Dehalococcoidia bacterium]|nr:Zn-ribbon domain-containing OB-fold protein [Dehalococcoidia bacterium]
MAEYNKPLPAPSKDSEAFWEGCKRHELLIQECLGCGKLRFYPRVVCPNCMSSDFEWRRASGKGTVYTFSVLYRGPTQAFKAECPYTLALVELDEGVRMTSNIVGCRPDDVRIGMKVQGVFEDVT